MADRRAPITGYDFEEKSNYRQIVWNSFRDNLSGVGRLHGFLMPSQEGLEIDVALSKGFREENLHICDRNPAIVAVLKRKYPRINTYGCEVQQAANRIAAKGIRLSAINIDLTSNASLDVIATLADFGKSGCMAAQCLVSVTLQRGREIGAVGDIVRDSIDYDGFAVKHVKSVAAKSGLPLKNSDFVRVTAAATVLSGLPDNTYIDVERVAAYPSNKVSMLYVIFKVGGKLPKSLIKQDFASLILMMAKSYDAARTLARFGYVPMNIGGLFVVRSLESMGESLAIEIDQRNSKVYVNKRAPMTGANV